MLIVYDPEDVHKDHAPPNTFELGRFIPYYDIPIRLENVHKHLRTRFGATSFLPYADYGRAVLLRVHAKPYIYFLEHIVDQWEAHSAELTRGVLPDVYRPPWHGHQRGTAFTTVSLRSSSWNTLLRAAVAMTTFHVRRLFSYVVDFVKLPYYLLNRLIYGSQAKATLSRDRFSAKRSSQRNFGLLDAGNPGYYMADAAAAMLGGTWKASYVAAQVAVTAAEMLAKDPSKGALFAMCRPPGHHAHSDMAAGFCFLNNVAIATQFLIDHYGKRVTILDIDYHHGNGTQQIFYDRANPKFISLHGSPDFPLFSGFTDERGEGEGFGYTVNLPLAKYILQADYLDVLQEVIDTEVLYRYSLWKERPDILVVSLGVDTYENDPIGTFQVTQEGYTKIGQMIGNLGIPTLFVMEGGYDIEAIGTNIGNVLSGFESTFKYKINPH